jgi:hypothetical protein
MKDRLKNSNGTLTRYALACGYIESKVSLESEDRLTLELDSIYHVKGCIGFTRIWESFDTLTEARKFYRSIRINRAH